MKTLEQIVEIGKAEGYDTLPKDDNKFKIYNLAVLGLEELKKTQSQTVEKPSVPEPVKDKGDEDKPKTKAKKTKAKTKTKKEGK